MSRVIIIIIYPINKIMDGGPTLFFEIQIRNYNSARFGHLLFPIFRSLSSFLLIDWPLSNIVISLMLENESTFTIKKKI